MRKPMPLRWIEEAEARQVLVLARCEALPSVFRFARKLTPWVERLHGWVLSRQAAPAGQDANTAANDANAGERPDLFCC